MHVLCPDDCIQYHHVDQSYNFSYGSDFNENTGYNNDNEYVKFEDENDFNDNFNTCQYETINDKNIDNNDLAIGTDSAINENIQEKFNVTETVTNDINERFDHNYDNDEVNDDCTDDRNNEIVEANKINEEVINDNLDNDLEKIDKTEVRKTKVGILA